MAPTGVQSVARRKKLNKSTASTLDKPAPMKPATHVQQNFARGGKILIVTAPS